MRQNKTVGGHAAALLTSLIWGTTFISTKVLLRAFSPVEILFIRFLMGYLALWLVCPRRLVLAERKREGVFALAGLCGVTLYYLCENIALTYTQASNVGVIVSAAPCFTALFDRLFLHGEKPGRRFFLGFLLAMGGICLISFSGTAELDLNPLGNLLGLAAAVLWAAYSTLTKIIGGYGCGTIQATRRTFFYGLIFMLPALFLMDFRVGLAELLPPENLLNLLFLGLGASALCFVTWNAAVKRLGAVKTSAYIYLVPVITTAASVLLLDERVTPLAVCGIALTLAGLVLSQGPARRREAATGG